MKTAIAANPDAVATAAASIQSDLSLAVLKSVHALWLMHAFAEMGTKRNMIMNRWKNAGILDPEKEDNWDDTVIFQVCGLMGAVDMRILMSLRYHDVTNYGIRLRNDHRC